MVRVIAESGNRGYYEVRAFELVREAGEALELDANPAAYHEKMNLAIGLLALARSCVGAP